MGEILAARLVGAKRYDRIAGYFRASLLDVIGEALEGVGTIRVVCNGELDPADIRIARAARDGSGAIASALVATWRAGEAGLDALLARDRYRQLHALLASGQMRVRVVARDSGQPFLHGKAGVIEAADGSRSAFVGSANDSAAGLRGSYEMLWLDAEPAAADWVQAEFDHWWDQGIDLPDAVIAHVGVAAVRTHYTSLAEARADPAPAALAPAVLAERPLYRAGQILRPWQKRFVQACVDDRALYGGARLLLADDVGLGKTLSLGAAALVLSMADDAPVLILAPSTLTWQWQAELRDMLGVPAAVWSTTRKQWMEDPDRALTPRGDVGYVRHCPLRFGIMSTGLIVNGRAGERETLERMDFSVVILDEAHKARATRGGPDGAREGTNNLLAWMERVAPRAKSLLLGTATPIQLRTEELWDLVHLLHQGAPQVLGKGFSEWSHDGRCIRYLSGARPWPVDAAARWELLRNPLPPATEAALFRDVRRDAGLAANEVRGPQFLSLGPDSRADLRDDFKQLAERCNPIIRRVVRRTRPMLEERGLLPRIAVAIHPIPADGLPARLFDGEGLVMGPAFTEAYEAAEAFCRLYAKTHPAAGFLKTILLRRIGSSPAAGLNTARKLLDGDNGIPEAEQGDEPPPEGPVGLLPGEAALLARVIENLTPLVASPDPKLEVTLTYLRDRGWLGSHGAILFSQYRDTAEWAARFLSAAFPGEPVALYAGGAASFVMRGGVRQPAVREEIKDAVQRGDIRLLAATDAACEGLNLQRLGSQFNLDLPWNPSRLEQRKGRVQRIGQSRPMVHVVNLRYAGTVEDDVYTALSERMGDIFAVIGQLPDGFEDAWVDAVLVDRDAVRHFPQRMAEVRPPMELRYAQDISDDRTLDWEAVTRVVAERNLQDHLRKAWA